MSVEDKKKEYKRVSEFYDEKSLFVTGVSGFLGSVLLGILLQNLPQIKRIFILLRPKKGVLPAERKKIILQKKLFHRLLEENPSAAEKVIAVHGDITLPNLGMSDEDLAKVTEEVTIVFHIAAVVSFTKPLRYMANQNSVCVKHVIEFARKLKKLEALVYTSTAFSNANQHGKIEETIYRLPWTGERFLKALESGENGEFEKLAAECKPEWPNQYTFSKSLAENIVDEMASDLPVVIIRPSIIVNCWRSPLKGYIEEGFGIVDLPLLTGRGFCKVLLADENARIDIVPVDIVANMHIVAAWSVGTKRMPSMSIINCTAGPWFLTYGSYIETWKKLYSQFLLPKSFQKLSLSVAKNIYVYKLLVLYEHYLPAYVLDLIFSLQKSKVRLVKFYKLLDEQAYAFHFFTTTVFDFEMGNFITVEEQLDSRDKEMFSLRRDDIDIIKLHEEIPNGCPYYDWKVADTLTPEERKVKVIRQTYMTRFIQVTALISLGYILYACLGFISALIL